MNELKEIQLDEVSIVDEGANPQAHIVLIKRKEEKSMAKEKPVVESVKQETEVLKAEGTVENVDVEKAELQKRVAELEKVLAERDAADKAELEKAAAEKLAADNKALTDMFERLNKRLEEHVEKAETAELTKVASKYEILGEKTEELVKAFKLAKAAGNYDTLIGLLDKSLAAVEKAGTFAEIGKTGASSQAVSVKKIAEELMKKDSNLTEAQAMVKAFEARPEFID